MTVLQISILNPNPEKLERFATKALRHQEEMFNYVKLRA